MMSAITQKLSAFLILRRIFLYYFHSQLFFFGLLSSFAFQKIGLPRIIGMLAIGIIAGPYVLDLLNPSILGISSELRQIALIIILVNSPPPKEVGAS